MGKPEPGMGSVGGITEGRLTESPEMATQRLATPVDAWADRGSGMRCHTCMFYVPKEGDKGRCRRHAPTMGGYPVVFTRDWCGDHKLR